jgi:hypothetical protein
LRNLQAPRRNSHGRSDRIAVGHEFQLGPFAWKLDFLLDGYVTWGLGN